MKNFIQKNGSEAEWNDAYCRLDNYLCALRILNPAQRRRIILRLLERTASRHLENPAHCPMALAMQEVNAVTGQWFEQIFSSRKRASVKGFVALLAVDAPEKWPAAFLAEEIPPDFQRALLECRAHAAPDLQVSSMVPQPFANPLPGGINLPDSLTNLARSVTSGATKGAVSLLSVMLSLWGNLLR